MRQKKLKSSASDFDTAIDVVFPTMRPLIKSILDMPMIEPRTYTHSSRDGSFTVTVREELGRDTGNAQFIRLTLRDVERKRLGLTDKDMIPDVLWENISAIAQIITQTVEATGAPCAIPRYTDTTEKIADFYDYMLELPAMYMTIFKVALQKVGEVPVPLATGSTGEKPSASESTPVLAELTS